jgi:DNA-binding transcriptional regulator YhcF (GntR family)
VSFTGPLPELVVVTGDPTPPYEQLRRQLAGLIRGGVLAPGERLPPLRQLAGDLGLAVGTVARTYRELEVAGLVVSRRGGGTRVADPQPAGSTAAPPGGVRGPAPAAGRRWASADGGGRDVLRRAAEEYVRRARQLGADRDETTEAVRRVLDATP